MRALSTAASIGRHSINAAAEALIIVAIAITLVLGLALATRGGSPLGADPVMGAKGGARGGSIIVPDGVYGDTTTATVNTTSTGIMAFAQCYQQGARVYAQFVSVDSSGHATFKLGPTQLWTGGSATCTAEAGAFAHGGRWRAQAATTFNAAG